MRAISTLAVILCTGLFAQARPDFSGTWTFDREKSMQPDATGRVVVAAMLGDEVVVLQTAASLIFRISYQGDTIVAVYDLRGVETENVSPGDIKVKSRASWEGEKLVIESTSDADERGRPITVRTRRVIWIDRTGDLIVDRTGTPASQVTPSRSVYRRAR